MKFNPPSYQQHATGHVIKHEYCGLFLEMGLGKTAATLTAINKLMFEELEINKVLVIAPKAVASTVWTDEVEKWDHLNHIRVSKVLGNATERKQALRADADIYVINRENVDWLVGYYGSAWCFDMVVIDELSSFKSAKAKRFKALKMARPMMKRVVGLTGTPAPNGLIDLWPQLYLLDQGERLGRTVGAYRRKYFTPGQRKDHVVYNYEIREGSEKAIYDKIGDICISMKAVDHIKMPERIDNTINVVLSDKDMARYLELEKTEILALPEGKITAATAAALSNKLLQFANGACYDDGKKVIELHDTKLDYLEESIEAVNGKPVLVLYNYKHDLTRILKRFPSAKKYEGEEDKIAWNKGEIPIMLAQPASTGHGLNLQDGGSTCIWFGLNWSLELNQQANARLYRQGQKNTVVINHLVTRGTHDELVMQSVGNKAATQNDLINAVKAKIKKYRRDI